jgi:hypothetical protein
MPVHTGIAMHEPRSTFKPVDSVAVSQATFVMFRSVHYALRTAHCVLRTVHCALHTAHSTL